MHQEVPAIWGRKNLLDEKIVDAIANIAIREREIEDQRNQDRQNPKTPMSPEHLFRSWHASHKSGGFL